MPPLYLILLGASFSSVSWNHISKLITFSGYWLFKIYGLIFWLLVKWKLLLSFWISTLVYMSDIQWNGFKLWCIWVIYNGIDQTLHQLISYLSICMVTKQQQSDWRKCFTYAIEATKKAATLTSKKAWQVWPGNLLRRFGEAHHEPPVRDSAPISMSTEYSFSSVKDATDH